MTEREGTPADFAAMLRASRTQDEADAASAESSQEGEPEGQRESDHAVRALFGDRAKLAQDRALIALLHPDPAESPATSTEVDFDGGARGPAHHSDPTLRHHELPPLADEPREIGWGPVVELEDGAALLFPELDRGSK